MQLALRFSGASCTLTLRNRCLVRKKDINSNIWTVSYFLKGKQYVVYPTLSSITREYKKAYVTMLCLSMLI